jgi:hypothetical protein
MAGEVLAMSPSCPLNRRPCDCDPNAAEQKHRPCKLAKSIGALIRLLGASIEGEAVGAVHALRRLLPGKDLNFHDIAVLIENCESRIESLKYSDSDAQAIYRRGLEVGREQGGGRLLSADYFDDDGEPRWVEIAKFCQAQQLRLNPKEQEFVDEMPGRLRWRPPSQGQGGFLLSIFWKTRGSLR